MQIFRSDKEKREWNQLGVAIEGETTDNQSGWSVSLSGDGNKLAVGAISNDGNGSNSGQVCVFRLDEKE